MYQLVKKHWRIATIFSLCFSLTVTGAAAWDDPATINVPENQPIALLSASISTEAGTVLHSSELLVAEKVLEDARIRQAEQEAAAREKERILNAPITARAVFASSELTASNVIKTNSKALGNFKLTFYCPCAKCCGKHNGITATGTKATEGRTIAVDPRLIPYGSRVYIEGYGMFIAEDCGGSIKKNRIDVFLNSHTRCNQLGIDHASVYVLN